MTPRRRPEAPTLASIASRYSPDWTRIYDLVFDAVGKLPSSTAPLEEIVRAHEYVEAGHKKGNVAIRMPAGTDG